MKMEIKPINIVYNSGIVQFLKKNHVVDEFGTVIRGKYTTTVISKRWYRNLGITTDDIYKANAMDCELTMKVGVHGNLRLKRNTLAIVDDSTYAVFRAFYNYKRDETEISLREVEEDDE